MQTSHVLALGLLLGLAAAPRPAPRPPAQAPSAAPECGGPAKTYVRTTLYFGLSRPAGTIREDQWQAFLRDQVTPRFPEGLTVWDAHGQWRRPDGSVARERAKVLLVIHDGRTAALAALTELVDRYKSAFEQESVLWESATVCAAF
jgi:hypothetical protein